MVQTTKNVTAVSQGVIVHWGGRGSVVRVGRPITWKLAVQSPLSPLKKIGELTVGGVAVHLLVTAEVPLSKAPYPHAPRALWMAAHHSSV